VKSQVGPLALTAIIIKHGFPNPVVPLSLLLDSRTVLKLNNLDAIV